MNIVSTLLEACASHPERIAFIQDDRSLTYGELCRKVKAMAQCIDTQCHGHHRIAIRLANTIEDIITGLAVIHAGHSLVALSPKATAPEKQAHLESCCAQILLESEPVVSLTPLDAAGPETDAPPVATNDIAFIRPTSGTTGKSKGVMLSHRCIEARIASANAIFGLTPDDVIIWTMECSFHFASSILLYLLAGAQIILTPDAGSTAVLGLAYTHRATMLYGSPWQYRVLAADTSGLELSKLRWAISTGQTLPAGIAKDFHARFKTPLRQAYGMIEAGLVSINTSIDPARADHVGPPAPGFEVMVTDTAGIPLPDGHVGEVHIKGTGLFSGYITPPTPITELLVNDFFPSGDLGVIDKGSLALKGRTASQLNVAGHKVFPEEIEAVIDSHPSIKKSRVSGIANARMGHIICAEIVPSNAAPPDTSTLLAHCRKHLAPYKIPLEFKTTDAISFTPSGKIKRH